MIDCNSYTILYDLDESESTLLLLLSNSFVFVFVSESGASGGVNRRQKLRR